jgi:hypothetical protein
VHTRIIVAKEVIHARLINDNNLLQIKKMWSDEYRRIFSRAKECKTLPTYGIVPNKTRVANDRVLSMLVPRIIMTKEEIHIQIANGVSASSSLHPASEK